MPLTQAALGKAMVVSRITGGGDVRRHLSGLGFVEGGEVTVVNDTGAGLIVSVKGARVALSRGMASRIMI